MKKYFSKPETKERLKKNHKRWAEQNKEHLNKYFVMDTSGKKYSKKPLSLARAKRQLAALHIHTGHGLIVGYDKPEKSLKGGITNKRYYNFLERLMILSKNVYDNYDVSSDGDIKSSNPMELIMAMVQTYFSPTEYELINNSTLKDNLRQLFDVTHIDQFITLVRSFYPNGRFETFIRMFIRDFQNVDLSPNEKIDKIKELLKLVEFELLEEMFKQYIQEPVDYSKIRKEFKGGGYYQNELHRRMERFPEHIANPIIARTLPLLQEVGPSRQLFSNSPARQQQKQHIIDNAIDEAQEITNSRRQRILPRDSTYVTSMEDIENNDQVIDYDNNSSRGYYHSIDDWNAWLNERQRQGLPFTDPWSQVIVKDRNIERFIAKEQELNTELSRIETTLKAITSAFADFDRDTNKTKTVTQNLNQEVKATIRSVNEQYEALQRKLAGVAN